LLLGSILCAMNEHDAKCRLPARTSDLFNSAQELGGLQPLSF
jgi:hypothetical protein